MGVEDLLHRAIGELSGAVATRTAGTCHYRQPQTYHSRRTEFVCGQTVREQLLQTVGRDKQEIAIVLVSHDVGTIISQVKNIACVNQTLHYHSGSNISQEWLMGAYDSCPIEIIGHGAFLTGYCYSTTDHQEE